MPDRSFRSEAADLQWGEDGLPFSRQFQDVYYSKHDAAGESGHVFLAGNKLAERWSQASKHQEIFVIAELGFGAGLNFMLCWQLWSQGCQRHADWRRLHFIAYERFPVQRADLLRLHQQWPALGDQSAKLLASYRSDSVGLHRYSFDDDVVLDLVIGDAEEALSLRHPQDRKVDAWFLDGFSPGRNPRMWSATLFQQMARHSHCDSTVATYSSAGDVRRNLQAAGFHVQKMAGFAGKRHMLVATACSVLPPEEASQQSTNAAPWFHLPARQSKNKKAIVIGAGLAGCHAAYALARRNWQVQVLEKETELASGVTAIPQLALRCRLFNQANVQSRILLQAYTHALSIYRSLQEEADSGWYESGLWQLADALNKRNPLQRETIAELYPASIVSTQQHCKLLDRDIENPAYWFPEGGWANPHLLCLRLLAAENISLELDCPVTNIRRHGNCWELSNKENVCGTAEVVILANGSGLSRLMQTKALPLEPSTGQCTIIAGQEPLNQLNSVVCGSRTLFPTLEGRQTVAASYRQAVDPWPADASEDAHNLAELEKMFPGSELATQVLDSRVAARINTRDRLPLVGPLADLPAMAEQYGELARNAKKQFFEHGHYHQGLYISAGHGSNGLTTCALGGEYLASLINDDCLPIDRQASEALNPCRFLIQDLKKQRTN